MKCIFNIFYKYKNVELVTKDCLVHAEIDIELHKFKPIKIFPFTEVITQKISQRVTVIDMT